MGFVVAIMNAQDVLARDLCDYLTSLEDAETGWIETLRLFGTPDESFIRFRDKDVYVEAFDAKDFDGVDLALCGDNSAVDAGAVAIRVARPDDAGSDAPVVLTALNSEEVDEHRGTVLVPTGAAGAVAHIASAMGATGITGTVLEPASMLGPNAMEELYGQTVALLNHRPLETAAIGDRLAFNVLPGRSGVSGVDSLCSCPVSLTPLLVPVFGGTTLTLHLTVAEDTSADAVEAALTDAGIEIFDDVQPASTIGTDDIRVQILGTDGNRVRLLVAVDEVRREAAAIVAAAREVIAQEAF